MYWGLILGVSRIEVEDLGEDLMWEICGELEGLGEGEEGREVGGELMVEY